MGAGFNLLYCEIHYFEVRYIEGLSVHSFSRNNNNMVKPLLVWPRRRRPDRHHLEEEWRFFLFAERTNLNRRWSNLARMILISDGQERISLVVKNTLGALTGTKILVYVQYLSRSTPKLSMYLRFTFFVKSQHSKKFVWPLFLSFRPFHR